MKKSLMMGVALAGLLAGSAVAADQPVKARPYIAPAPAFSWTGCYVGVQVGAGAMHDSWTGENGNGGLAGGRAGCNYQTGMIVVGVEGDGFWSGMKTEYNDFGVNGDPGNPLTTKNKYDYWVAGRVGLAFDRSLIYGKAGWVWGKFDFNYTNNGEGYTHTGSDTLNGLLMGVGFEYAFTNNWTTYFEYDYLNFGSKNVLFDHCEGGSCAPEFYQSVSANKNIFKLGLNYKFY